MKMVAKWKLLGQNFLKSSMILANIVKNLTEADGKENSTLFCLVLDTLLVSFVNNIFGPLESTRKSRKL